MKANAVWRRRGLATACLLILLISLFGCGGKVEPIVPTEDDLRVALTAGGYDVCYDELRYYTCNLKDRMADYYGEEIWRDEASAAPYLEELQQGVFDMSRYHAAVLSLCAEYGISVTERGITDGVQAEIEAMVEEYGSMKAYTDALAENYMTDHFFRYAKAVEQCETELYNVMFDLGLLDHTDEAAEAYFASDAFIRTLHIYVANDAGENVADNRARAAAILAELEGGADFNTLIGRYSEDFYMTTTNGYYFGRGEMNADYERAAFALAEGEHSGVVETDTGFYIIKRLPKDAEYINRNFETLKSQYLSAVFYGAIEARRDEITVDYTAFGRTLALWSIR